MNPAAEVVRFEAPPRAVLEPLAVCDIPTDRRDCVEDEREQLRYAQEAGEVNH